MPEERTYSCRCTDGFGWIEKIDWTDGEAVKVVVPCRDCKPETYERWRLDFPTKERGR